MPVKQQMAWLEEAAVCRRLKHMPMQTSSRHGSLNPREWGPVRFRVSSNPLVCQHNSLSFTASRFSQHGVHSAPRQERQIWLAVPSSVHYEWRKCASAVRVSNSDQCNSITISKIAVTFQALCNWTSYKDVANEEVIFHLNLTRFLQLFMRISSSLHLQLTDHSRLSPMLRS